MAILFLIPGMVAFTVYRYVAGYAIDKLYKFIFYSAIWAILAYGIVEVIAAFIYDIPFGKYLNIWIMFNYKFADISVGTMFKASGAGIIEAFIIGHLMRRIRLNCAGLLHVKLWDHYVNLLCKKGQNVEIYDYKNNYKYIGNIKSFSYFSPQKEIVLQEAKIYSMQENEGKLLSENKEIYIQLEDCCFSIMTLKDKTKKGKEKEEKEDMGGKKENRNKN